MNRLTIIGNLTRDPELRTTPSGDNVCTFYVAVNRRQSSAQRQAGVQPETDFFRVTAWRELGTLCSKYLTKGRKVAVIGSVSCHTFTKNDGTVSASLDVQANEVEFLSPRQDDAGGQLSGHNEQLTVPNGYSQVETDLPF